MCKKFLTKLLLAAALFGGGTAAHADRFNEEARYAGFTALPAATSDDVVFIGNSITHMMNWWEAYGNRHNVHGRGNSGAKTYQALDNLESMIAGQPGKVFVMLGTNDFGDNDNAQHVTHLVKTLLKRIRLESPGTTVYCQSILPSGVGYRKGHVNEANELLKAWIAEEKDAKLVYVDLYTLFDDGTGSIKNRGANQDFTLSYDDLHLTPIGYRMWMEKIKELTGYETVIPNGAKNLHAGQQTSWGARIATFGTMPVTADDILMFGDDFIHYGEWHEMIGSTDFKDRGTGWQFFSSNISQVQAALEPALAKSNYNTQNCGVKRSAPRAVCISAGGRNVMNGDSESTLKQAYLGLLNAARNQVDATTPIFLMSILPVDNTTKNAMVKKLNAYMQQLADEKEHVYFVDLYSAMSTGDAQTQKYFHTDKTWTLSGTTLHPYPTPLGYVKAANVLCETINAQLGTHYTPITESDAQANIDRFTARSIVGNAVNDIYNKLYNLGDAPGQYSATSVEGAEDKIAEACKVLWNTTITTEQANAAIAPLQSISFTLNLPKVSEAGDGAKYYYTISTPLRDGYYVTSSGLEANMKSVNANLTEASQWMLQKRDNGTYDIVNRKDGGYISPVANTNSAVKCVKARPAAGWNIEPSNSAGYFIIYSGDTQLNQTRTGQQFQLYNWGHNTNNQVYNTSDTGCQFRFVLVEEVGEEPAIPAGSALNNLMPRPQQVTVTSGTFTGRIADASVTVDASAVKTFDYTVAGFDNEGYTLSITPTGITIKAASSVGVIRAKQTLRQLIPDNASLDFSDLDAIDASKVTLECCEITDYPAFKVRGFMHDVGRSFISYEELKKEIDLLSRFKVNVFHWHLTDNHAFRFESKKRPVVNTKFERFPEGIYTQQQCRELDAYATERGITIIPEIDMPGHSRQFKNATGYDMTSATGKEILKDVLGELAECFPHAPYIHVGADESGATVAYVKEMTDHVHGLGKKTVCWNQYGAGTLVTPTTMGVDMLTNWATRGQLVSGVPNIDMRYFYVNHFDVFADLAGAYRSLIFNAERGNTNIGGVSIGIWNDRYLGDEKQIIAQNNVYATVMAMTERAWVGGEGHQYIERGGAYLPNEGREYDEYCDWERRFLYYKDKWLANEPIPYVKSSNVIWNITAPYNNGGNVSATFEPETVGAELTPQPGSTFATGAGQWLNHIWNSTVTGVIGSQGYNQTRYAWTYVYSDKDQEVGAQIEFRNYSRSDGGLVPQNKKWDIMGSRVWINDSEVLPDWDWTNANTNPDLEKELGNLNFPGRAPVKVQLKAGWNKVLLKCPFIDITNSKGRRSKWQYTFVFTDVEGKNAVDGLIYSPNKLMDGEDFSIPEVAPDPTISVPTEGKTYNIHATYSDGSADRYLVNTNGTVTTVTEKPEGEEGLWTITNSALQSVSDPSLYVTVDGTMKLVSSPVTLSFGEGLTDGAYCITAPGNKNGGVNTNGNTGLFTNGRYNVTNGWSTDFIFEEYVEGIDYTVDKNGGNWTATNPAGTWASKWTSNDGLLTFTAGANNMQWQGTNIDARSGQSGNSNYTLAAAEGYVISAYSFKATALTSNQTWNVGGKNNTVTKEGTTFSADNLNESSVDFILSGDNSGTLLTEFCVTLKPMTGAPQVPDFFRVFDNASSSVPYRIPAVAKNQKGDLIFVADYRYSGKDIGVQANGKLDLRVRTRYAGGTWSEVTTLAKCIESPTFTAFGDPCIVADRTSNRIMVTSCCGNVSFPNGQHNNHQGWARFYSEDGGKTWGTHTDISQQVFDQLDKRSDGQIRCFFIGSGKISQSTRVKVGDYYRLYCAALVKNGGGNNVNYAFYSDDFGETWNLLGEPDDCPIPSGGDEPKAEELPDGSIIISSRSTGRIFNVFHFTDVTKGLGKWGKPAVSSTANNGCYGTSCNGEIMILPVERADKGGKTYLALQSVPAASDRRNVSIYYKELTDLAQYRTGAEMAPEWNMYQVSKTTSAYSTMCLDQNNHLAFFYEENSYNNGYDMIYKDLSIEDITRGAYSYAEMTAAEHKAYLSAGVDPYFSDKEWAQEDNVAALIEAYKTNPTDDNYCALNAVLNDLVLPSANAKPCPYASPVPSANGFAQDSKAYIMQIKGNYYITTKSMTEGNFNVNSTTRPNSAEGYWVIAGDLATGYSFYNVGEGPSKVLGITGSEDKARAALYPIDEIPAGVHTYFDYAPSTASGSTTGSTFFIHGTDNNALNVRAPYLALWQSVNVFTDNGSRIELIAVDYKFPDIVGIADVTIDSSADSNRADRAAIYDLQGRRVSRAAKGVFVQDGKVVIR